MYKLYAWLDIVASPYYYTSVGIVMAESKEQAIELLIKAIDKTKDINWAHEESYDEVVEYIKNKEPMIFEQPEGIYVSATE